MKNDANKQFLISSIAVYAKSMVLEPSQQVVVTCRNQVLTNYLPSIIEENLLLWDNKKLTAGFTFMNTRLLKMHFQLLFRLLTLIF